jgi:hypothetical protein
MLPGCYTTVMSLCQSNGVLILFLAKQKKITDQVYFLFKSDRYSSCRNIASGVIDSNFHKNSLYRGSYIFVDHSFQTNWSLRKKAERCHVDVRIQSHILQDVIGGDGLFNYQDLLINHVFIVVVV